MTVPFRIQCPYCGERIELELDDSVADQCYIEDCAVCCQPIALAVAFDPAGVPHVQCAREDEA